MLMRDVIALGQARKLKKRTENEKVRKEAEEHAVKLSQLVLDDLDGGINRCWKTQNEIDALTKQLVAETKKFTRQTSQWAALYTTFNDSLKEVGDVENWLKAIESDMQAVSEMLVLASEEHAERIINSMQEEMRRHERGDDISKRTREGS